MDTDGILKDKAGRRGRRRRLVILAGIMSMVLLLTASGAAAYYFVKYRDLQNKVASSEQLSEEEVINKINRLYDAPNERPSIAQVNDKSQLNGQEFFSSAQKADYVAVYPDAKIAILYRASEDRIINIGPIVIDSEQGMTNEVSP